MRSLASWHNLLCLSVHIFELCLPLRLFFSLFIPLALIESLRVFETHIIKWLNLLRVSELLIFQFRTNLRDLCGCFFLSVLIFIFICMERYFFSLDSWYLKGLDRCNLASLAVLLQGFGDGLLLLNLSFIGNSTASCS